MLTIVPSAPLSLVAGQDVFRPPHRFARFGFLEVEGHNAGGHYLGGEARLTLTVVRRLQDPVRHQNCHDRTCPQCCQPVTIRGISGTALVHLAMACGALTEVSGQPGLYSYFRQANRVRLLPDGFADRGFKRDVGIEVLGVWLPEIVLHLPEPEAISYELGVCPTPTHAMLLQARLVVRGPDGFAMRVRIYWSQLLIALTHAGYLQPMCSGQDQDGNVTFQVRLPFMIN